MLQFAGLLNYRILCHTTFTISNVVGPQEEIMIGGNPITFLRANSSALPHVWPLISIFPHRLEYFKLRSILVGNITIIVGGACNAGADFEYGELCWKGRHASAGGQRHHSWSRVSCQVLWRCIAWNEGAGYGQNLTLWRNLILINVITLLYVNIEMLTITGK